MFETLQEIVLQRNYSILDQILQKISFFRQAKSNLSSEHYRDILEQIQIVKIHQFEPNYLSGRFLYLFFTKVSLLVTKNINSETGLRLKRKSILAQNYQKKIQSIAMITQTIQIGSFQILGEQNFLSGGTDFFYQILQTKKPCIVKLDYKKIKESTINILKEKYAEKIQFFSGFDIFQGFNRTEIQLNLSKFQFRIYKFDQCLQNQINGQKDLVFFLKSGEIQVNLNNQSMKSGYIASGPTIIGYDKLTEDESLRCITEKCYSYIIKKTVLDSFLTKDSNTKQNDNLSEKYHLVSNNNDIKEMRKYIYRKKPSFTQKIEFNKTDSIWKNIIFSPNKNKQAIIQFSCSSFNNKCKQFLEKKERLQLSKKIGSTNLYEIKLRKPHFPEMTIINQKLKNIRLAKFMKIKKDLMQSRENRLIRNYQDFIENQKNQIKNQNIKKKFVKRTIIR